MDKKIKYKKLRVSLIAIWTLFGMALILFAFSVNNPDFEVTIGNLIYVLGSCVLAGGVYQLKKKEL